VGEDDPTSRRAIGCAFEVANVLGPGFLESGYEKALCVELAERRPQPKYYSVSLLICWF